ncbi:hydroxyacylglutathione hydrolase [Pelagibacterium lentulum]|uniref:Hydroxyacylglutathione hydrolase n=1 Tax=Pelagibacterium lentulum TaxID=2029865 RepID=A0A916R5E4_9HYPH|nr:hydroxyacylglutathione hydrolase [Pelagibacterium lentulum]GGA35228.1 hydroxyacylglutathione hydrolase [Pelagibacterium lentulum]
MALDIAVFPARSDNFGYLVRDTRSGRVAAIDAPEEAAILAELSRRGWHLTDILITHHHPDHTEAIMPLKSRFDVHVAGPRAEADKIEGLDQLVEPGQRVKVGDAVFDIIAVPGHTLGHIAYFCEVDKALFCGDALFSLGVGRMFEGTPGPMWEGLLRMRDLDPETRIYCGHEYSLANAKFALHVDPDNTALQNRYREIEAQLGRGAATIPSRLADEIAANPFLRADDRDLAGRMGLSEAPASEVFAALRQAKDNF